MTAFGREARIADEEDIGINPSREQSIWIQVSCSTGVSWTALRLAIFREAPGCLIAYHEIMRALPLHRTILAIVVGMWCIPLGSASGLAAPPSPAAHTLIIQSGEALELSPKNEKEWFERGLWPLAGAVAALMITNAVAVSVVYIQSSKSFKAVLKQRKIENLSASLSEFYDPLIALLDINCEIFARTGPPSFPPDDPARSAAGLVWKETKKKILANNSQVEAILRTKTHLIQEPDSLANYHRLLVHVAMYETFQTIESDLYAGFQFPADIRDHVETQRLLVLQNFNEATGELI